MNYKMYSPPEELQGYVRYFWEANLRDNNHTQTFIASFADRYPQLIFQNLDGYNALTGCNGKILPTAYVRGVVTRNPSYTIVNSFDHLGVSFYPHALKRLFHVDAYELTDKQTDLVHFSYPQLHHQLQDAQNTAARINILSKFLINQLNRYRKVDELIQHLMEKQNLSVHTTVAHILNTYTVSERQLERKFNAVIGVSPKMYLQIIRFEQAIHLLNNSSDLALSAIAFDLGYSDQSHFNREFKKYTGFTPTSFLRQPKMGEENSSFVINSSTYTEQPYVEQLRPN